MPGWPPSWTPTPTPPSSAPDPPPASSNPRLHASRGLPQEINRIAHYALSACALGNAHAVTAEHLQTALDELRP